MGCDYYINSFYVVHYTEDDQTVKEKRVAVSEREPGYIGCVSEYDSDDNAETKLKKINKQIDDEIDKYNTRKDLYKDGKWVNDNYTHILNQFEWVNPVSIVYMYKENYAYKR